jgi:DNA-binding CsgD family transcriptional regulator
VKALTLREIQLRLDDRLDLLRGSERGQGDSRHLSLRAALGWSHGLLSPEEQKLLRRFSVFQGGGRLSSIAAICHDESLDSRAIQANLVSLVGKSLVEAETIGLAEARYQLTNSIRIFGFENLQEAGEENWVRERHFEHFLSNADACALQLQESSEQSAMEWMELESDNLRAALAWSLESGNIEVGLQLAIACSQFWTLRGISHEGLLWFERLLGRSDVKISTYTRLDALVRASALAMFSGDQKSVDQYARELTEIGEELNSADEPDLLLALGGLVFSAHGMGDYETAFRLQDKAIKLLENSDDAYSLGMALILQGGTAVAIGKLDVASGLLVQGEALAREAGDTFRYALALRFEGDLARCQEDYTLAQKQYERSETLLRALGPGRDLATVLCSLGYVHLHFNRPAKGFELFNEAMQMHQADSNHAGMVECLLGMGALAIQRGAFREGVHLLSAADALGGKRVANWAVNKLEKQKALQVAAQALDPLLLKEEQRYGFSLTMEEALRIVENLLAVGEENPSSKLLDALTGREREVVGALIRGMSNEEIAAEFMISVRTVEKHVSNVLSKLNLARRTQIVHWVNEQGLNEFLS